ncbi:unnamed protein product [Arctia plantaginis]|uniref:Uncharacterized protein n=1 Tax=Arctia plantaginis TaxID=874455 RepID=A0A8S1B064_ARCPL|nr:unnamed protein product [Arctia plantaginis]
MPERNRSEPRLRGAPGGVAPTSTKEPEEPTHDALPTLDNYLAQSKGRATVSAAVPNLFVLPEQRKLQLKCGTPLDSPMVAHQPGAGDVSSGLGCFRGGEVRGLRGAGAGLPACKRAKYLYSALSLPSCRSITTTSSTTPDKTIVTYLL